MPTRRQHHSRPRATGTWVGTWGSAWVPACVAVALLLALFPVSRAMGDDDHDRARRAVEHVEMKPLSEIMDRVRDKVAGEIVGVEVERKKGRWVYELRVVSRTGRLKDIYVDGATGTILKSEED